MSLHGSTTLGYFKLRLGEGNTCALLHPWHCSGQSQPQIQPAIRSAKPRLWPLVTLVTLDMQNCTSARRIEDFTLHLKESHQSHLQRRLDHVHSAAASSPLDNQLVFSAWHFWCLWLLLSIPSWTSPSDHSTCPQNPRLCATSEELVLAEQQAPFSQQEHHQGLAFAFDWRPLSMQETLVD